LRGTVCTSLGVVVAASIVVPVAADVLAVLVATEPQNCGIPAVESVYIIQIYELLQFEFATFASHVSLQKHSEDPKVLVGVKLL